jgi:hypothetical protein
VYIELDWLGVEGFRVTELQFNVACPNSDSRMANCVPGDVRFTVQLPPSANPGKDFFGYASSQHDSDDKPKCVLRVYKGGEKKEGDSIQQIELEEFWIRRLDLRVQPGLDLLFVDVELAAGHIVISETEFIHPQRREHFLA